MMTNREWLESLPDEELAEWFLESNTVCYSCAHKEKRDRNKCIDVVCKWLYWLQQEHNDCKEI